MHTLKIKDKESQAKGKACVCALMLDEMAIHKKIEWDGENFVGSVLRIYFKYMYFYTLQNYNNYLSSIRFPIIHTGILHCRYVDIGTDEQSDNPVEAKEALVFLVNCVNDRWKLPVGYFLIDGVSGIQKSNLVKMCLQLLHDSGVTICSVTFDGTNANLAMAICLGSPLSSACLNPSFPHPVTGENIQLFLDPPHMFETLWGLIKFFTTTIIIQLSGSILFI